MDNVVSIVRRQLTDNVASLVCRQLMDDVASLVCRQLMDDVAMQSSPQTAYGQCRVNAVTCTSFAAVGS